MESKETLVISNLGPLDTSFTGEFGGRFLTYNVSRAQRDCDTGIHGMPWLLDVEPAYEANKGIEVEEDKVQRFMTMPHVLALPLILIMEGGMSWLIEGHHRLRALYRLGAREFIGYVIEEEHRSKYLVLFNGRERLPKQLSHWAGGAA